MSTFGCPHCGQPNPLNAPFCAHCGTDLRSLPPDDRIGEARPSGDLPSSQEPTSPGEEDRLLAEQPWLQPEALEPAPPEEEGLPEEQPWLRPAQEERDAIEPPRAASQRLVTGLQCLLEPVEDADLALGAPAQAQDPPPPIEDPETLQRWQMRFAEEVPLADPAPEAIPQPPGPRRGYGLEWIALAALVLGMWLLGPPTSRTTAHGWPGIQAAFQAVEALPPRASVLVDWAYDPATAGELDRVAYPVLVHLVDRNVQFVVVSQFPGGMATARRTLRAIQMERLGLMQALTAAQQVVEGGFLPGGAPALALLGQATELGLPVDLEGIPARERAPLQALQETGPALALVLAAHSEDVQRWLEQVQPLNQVPVLAVTAAGADPVLRPYWDSGQLVGLVSGYDGAQAYARWLEEPLPFVEEMRIADLQRGQQLGFWLLVVALVLGHLRILGEP